MTQVFNKTDEKFKRRMLRKEMPSAEIILWSQLKAKGLEGYKFRRQYSINQFVVDFYCPKPPLPLLAKEGIIISFLPFASGDLWGNGRENK
jgi:very-short-patch-repair endonuclease